MSAIGPLQTSSAFEGKADMAVCGCLLSRSLGAKRTCHLASHMSAFDPKRTRLFALHMSVPKSALKPESHLSLTGSVRVTMPEVLERPGSQRITLVANGA